MKHFSYTLFLALLAAAVVSLIFWLITGELNLVPPILGAIVVVILAIKASKNKKL